MFICLDMISSPFSKTRMVFEIFIMLYFLCPVGRMNILNGNLFCIIYTKCQLIPMDSEFHRITKWSKLDKGDFHTGNHTHIQKMLAEFSFSSYCFDDG